MTEDRRNERLDKDSGNALREAGCKEPRHFIDETDLTLKDFNNQRTEIRF